LAELPPSPTTMAAGIPVDLRVVMNLQALGVPAESISFR
jgi:hypothetical protein